MVQRERLHLLGGLVGLGGLAYLGLSLGMRARARERRAGSVGQPLLRLPFEAGTVVVCIQGNRASAPHTHSLPQNQHALDFAQPTDATVPVASAAAGEVSFVHDRSDPEDVDAGLGYGNHVKVLHPGGFNTCLSVAKVHHREVLATLHRRARVDEVARQRERRSPSWLHQELSEILDEDPGLPAALYLHATALEIPRGDWTSAHQSLDAALTEDATPRRREPWLAGRASYHLGRVLRAEGDWERARASFQHALTRSTSADLIADAKQALASLDAGRGR
ncbi:MAG: hypothetical protein KC731_41560 [Myxococcales bacterium]|nr:hypothetical protein [Myxococcales bacterium]